VLRASQSIRNTLGTMNERAGTHARPFQECITQLINVRGEGVVVLGPDGLRGRAVATVSPEWLASDSDLLGSSAFRIPNSELKIEQVAALR
jgi:hypothetical protein